GGEIVHRANRIRRLIYRAAAVHPATIRLPATRRRGCGVAALADGKRRELLLQLRGVALRTFGLLLAKDYGFKLVPALFATVFENRHNRSRTSQKRRFALLHLLCNGRE